MVTWRQFLKEGLPIAHKKHHSHKAAMKEVAKDWKAYKKEVAKDWKAYEKSKLSRR